MASAAYERFIESTKIGFDEWHDGTGYDVKAIGEATPDERASIERMLLARCPDDWRAVEALAALGTARAMEPVRSCLRAADPVIRVAAARELRARALKYRWYLEVQREALGFLRHDGLDEFYKVPVIE